MEKIEKLKQLLTDADALAKELIDDKQHKASVYVAPIRNKIATAIGLITPHAAWLAKQSKPEAKTK